MRPIKFDLPLNGKKIATLDQLEENLTPEILDSFRSGKLAKWLRARKLDEQAEAVEALLAADIKDEVQLFIKLCEVFDIEVDEEIARDMIEDYEKASLASKKVAEEAEKNQQTKSPEEYDDEEQNVVDEKVTEAKAKAEIVPAKAKAEEKKYVINQKLLAVLARDKSSFSPSFYVNNDIPSKKLKNAINAYGGVGVEYETSLVLFDGTVFFRSAEKGFLLTDESISIRDENDRKLAIPLRDISSISVSFSKSDGTHSLGINGKYFKFISSDEDNWKVFKAFFKDYLALE